MRGDRDGLARDPVAAIARLQLFARPRRRDILRPRELVASGDAEPTEKIVNVSKMYRFTIRLCYSPGTLVRRESRSDSALGKLSGCRLAS